MPASPFHITATQVIDSPEVSILVFHNVYPEGKQGGVELIQHGERVATNGDLRLEPAPGQWAPLPRLQTRAAGADQVAVRLAFSEPQVGYTVRVWPEGEQVHVVVDLEQPLPEDLVGRVGFNLELQPAALFGKVYFMDETLGAFPRQANGPTGRSAAGMLLPLPMARGRRLVAAPEDAYHRLEVSTQAGEMLLLDGRNASQNGWFVLRQVLPGGAAQEALHWILTPARVPGWQRAPGILLSQVGYHPQQEKQALFELDPRSETLPEVELLRLSPDGPAQVALSAAPQPAGRFLNNAYALFDFSAVRKTGLYQLRFGSQVTPAFQISREVYQAGVWQPTLETFLPNQMCHVRVEDFQRVWHGVCHLDDALQAPPDHEHFDGYRQYAETDTHYAAFEHIPGLDRGGWHDAGDYDLAAGSQASTTYHLALVREEFGVDSDQTTIQHEQRLVLLHEPDGKPDIVQQVAHGVESLLSGYRAAGHSFIGIIEGTLKQYTHLGDPATMTDNLVYTAGVELPRDDRWAFTNHNTALEYQCAAALAASSRVLRGYDDALAEECLETALKVWEHEHSHEPDTRPNCYIWNDPKATEVLAALELLKTTGEAVYSARLVEIWPEIEKRFGALGWAAAQAIALVNDGDFTEKVRQAALAYREHLQTELAGSPFRLPFGDGWLRPGRADFDPFAADYRPPIWGVGWSLQSFAVHYYYLVKAFPDLFEREPLLRVLNYVLGWHPGGSQSLVSGVGAQSLTMAYGTNRAEWSYTPGGIASGPALIRPGSIELMDPFPWLWQQKEYVIGGAATYIFLVLAADALLNQ